MGSHYPKAMFHLLLGIYCLEVCMIGLFIMAKDSSGKPICIAHAVIMGLVLVATGVFHYHICRIFTPVITYIPVCLGKLNEPTTAAATEALVGEHRERGPYSTGNNLSPSKRGNDGVHRRPSIRSLSEIFHPQRIGGGRYWHTAAIEEESDQENQGWDQLNLHQHTNHSRTEPKHGGVSSELFDGIEASLDNLTTEQREHLVSRAFHHEAVRAARPCVWIPRDKYGVAEDQIRDIRLNYPHILVSTEGCALDEKGRVVITRLPPDHDPTAQIRL